MLPSRIEIRDPALLRRADQLFSKHIELLPCRDLGSRIVDILRSMKLNNPKPTVVQCVEELEISGYVRIGRIGE